MYTDEWMIYCVLALPGVVLWYLWAFALNHPRGTQRSVRIQHEVLALREGETVVGVIDRRKGQSLFLVQDVHKSTNDG